MPARSVSFRHFILGLLNQEPMSGYYIKGVLRGLSWLVGDASFGSLYPALHALLKDGLATVAVIPGQDKPPRKVYTITERGRHALEQWVHEPQPSNASLKAFVMRLHLSGSLSHAGLVAHLEQRRIQVAAHRSELKQTAGALDQTADLGQRLTLNYGLALADAELDWLGQALNRLSQKPLPLELATHG